MSGRLFHRTRWTDDLPAKFRRGGRWWLIPILNLLRRSNLAREGIENSGSCHFADHLYANQPSGRGWLGRRIDAALLNLRASCAMRSRCTEASRAMSEAFARHPVGTPFRVLTVPCGLPRDVRDFAADSRPANLEYTGLDIDPSALTAARELMNSGAFHSARFVKGDALDAATWPSGAFDFISSTGLGEFLDDHALRRFYRNAHSSLAPGGTFFTSSLGHERKADWLLRTFEFEITCRPARELEALLAPLAWKDLRFSTDATGLTSFVRAVRQPARAAPSASPARMCD